MMTFPPAMPEASGPNPQRARFFQEVAAAMELMALYWSLPAERQRAWLAEMSAHAASAAERKLQS